MGPTYPGVYVEEIPSSVRIITGVATSITAFVGRALKGPVDKALTIHNFADFERFYGGLWNKSNMSYAVHQYFLNGGKDAVIIRAFSPQADSINQFVGQAKFKRTGFNGYFVSSNPGIWCANLNIKIDKNVDLDLLAEDNTLFNLTVTEANAGATEHFPNASTKPDSSRYIKALLETESNLIRIPDISFENEIVPQDTAESKFILEPNSASDGNDLIGNDIVKSLYLLDKVDLFNLLCIPSFSESGPNISDRRLAYKVALTYCEKKRAILIVDPPESWHDKDLAINGMKATGDEQYVARDKNAAIFFPRVKSSDPLEENRLRLFDPCGVIAGVIARTDSNRGVWKAPAGIEATLIGVADLEVRLTEDENWDLNQIGVNCLRLMPGAGLVVWGARTMRGDDRLADQWKYLPVRRMALYIEESLYRGTQWVVFEPNDENLWSQIRLNVGAFMQSLFHEGAFQGTEPKKAYFVKCDDETTTQDDINKGIVTIIVGFAPLKPAEFVIIKIQQLAGQEQ